MSDTNNKKLDEIDDSDYENCLGVVDVTIDKKEVTMKTTIDLFYHLKKSEDLMHKSRSKARIRAGAAKGVEYNPQPKVLFRFTKHEEICTDD